MRHARFSRAMPWRRYVAVLALLFLGLGAARPAWCGLRDAPGKDLQVALITYGPGTIYWERFGHVAIQIRDTVSGQSVDFNYGVFDFAQKDFLLNFARNRMNYMMDAESSAPEIAWYVDQHRSVRRQVLDLSPSQAARLRDFLLWNLLPQNLHYRYDYYTNNCSTKIRDAINRVLDGQLKAQLTARPGDFTYRQQTDRVMARQPWLMLLLDLGLSHYADRPLNAWQEAFLPVELSNELMHVRIAGASGGTRPLVASDTLLARSGLNPPPRKPPDLRLPLLLTGAALAMFLLLSGRAQHRAARIAFAGVATLWLLLAGLAGLFMLAIWTLTAHVAGWANANLLLFNPLAWLLLAAVWQRRVPGRAHLVAWTITVLSAVALLGNLTHLLAQRNLPWILLALPVWLALLHILRRRTAR